MKASHWIARGAALARLGCSPDPVAETLMSLPADTHADVVRAEGASPFDAVRTVALDLRVRLHDSAASGGRSLPPRDHVVVATIAGFDGEIAYRGSFGADGRLQAVVALPATPEDMMLRLEAPGFRGRLVEIPAMADLATVGRTMVLEADGSAVALSDNDRDGVPEALDADPRDGSVSFVNASPSEGFYTVAFEDMYKATRAGDADYNDFLADYRVVASQAPAGVSSVTVEAIGRRQWSSWNHAFGTTMSFDGAAEVTVEHFEAASDVVPTTVEHFAIADGEGAETAVIELFHSTRKAVGRRTVATIRFADPIDPATLSAAPFDPYLYVWSTGYDVHLASNETLPEGTALYEWRRNDADDEFVDARGYPYALLVPSSWITPGEAQYIGRAYPDFDAWREEAIAQAVADAE